MRLMILIKSSGPPSDAVDASLQAALAVWHAQLSQAGVLLDGAVLQPRADGWCVGVRDGRQQEVEAVEADPLLAGYTLIQVRSREEGLEWTRRFPLDGSAARSGTALEVRVVRQPV